MTAAIDIPTVHTPPGGYGETMPPPILAGCNEPLALAAGADLALPQARRLFVYMPYMHSESRAIHQVAEPLFRERAAQDNYEFELRHKAIIDRFGRYPHRNEALGRSSTPEELAFLAQPGSRF